MNTSDEGYDLYRRLSTILDTEDHDEECVMRCLRRECDDDHHCQVCGWPEPEADDPSPATERPQPMDGVGMGVIARSLGIGG